MIIELELRIKLIKYKHIHKPSLHIWLNFSVCGGVVGSNLAPFYFIFNFGIFYHHYSITKICLPQIIIYLESTFAAESYDVEFVKSNFSES